MADESYGIWVEEEAEFDPRGIAPIRHSYHDHPLLSLEALEQLAERLMPTQQCRFAAGPAQPDSPFEHDPKPHDGRDIRELFATMERPESWIALYDVQTDPAYRELLDDVRQKMQRILGQRQRVLDVRGFIFISAPPSVTPFHIDRENNFWMQIRGRKLLHLWERDDPHVLDQSAVEEFIMLGALDRVRMGEDTMARAHRFDCGPGDGAYFPSTTPHMTRSERDWVTPGDGVAVSIGMVFYTDETRHYAGNHVFNWELRRLGLGLPLPAPGKHAWLDRLRAPLGRASLKLRERLRGHRVPPGIL